MSGAVTDSGSGAPPVGVGLAIVTGASSGIGEELALQLARSGRPVLAVARREARLRALAERAGGGSAPIHPLAVDLLAPGAILEIKDRAKSLGGAAWLVNNAGTARFAPFTPRGGEGKEGEELAAMIRLNCESLVSLTRAILPDIVGRGGGAVVNVASAAGFQPTPGYAVYGATKAFVLSFSEAIAEELRGSGVTVTAVCPGPVQTEIFAVGAPGMERRPTRADLSAAECAQQAIRAAERGAVLAVPGRLNALRSFAARLAPRAAARRLSARMSLTAIGLPAAKRGP
jgi:short-subunit dehydrogenase